MCTTYRLNECTTQNEGRDTGPMHDTGPLHDDDEGHDDREMHDMISRAIS